MLFKKEKGKIKKEKKKKKKGIQIFYVLHTKKKKLGVVGFALKRKKSISDDKIK